MASFETIADRAHDTPVVSTLPPLGDFYLDEFAIYSSVDGFHRDLYDPNHAFDQDVIIDEGTRHSDYPRIDCTADPITPRLNDVVAWEDQFHHDRIQDDLLCQSAIKNHIVESITGEELVVLVIVDGLSYETVRSLDGNIRPVVVDGFTTTGPGFRRVIYGGDVASLYAALTSKGFYKGYGFTYWERGQEELSTGLHSAIDTVDRIEDFGDALSTLEADQPFSDKTYVQITRMGFDQHCHNRKEEPNWSAIRDEILEDIRAVAETAADITDKFRVFVTGDHGVIWQDQLPEDPPIVHDEWADHARFLDGAHDLEKGLTVETEDGDAVTGLAYPCLTRELKNTEWGVHGGFSYNESIVPLIEITTTGDTL